MPATKIGKGKKGTLKRAAFKADIGRKGLKTLRSLSKAQRQQVKGNGRDLKATVKNIRTARAKRGASMTKGGGVTKSRRELIKGGRLLAGKPAKNQKGASKKLINKAVRKSAGV